MKTLKIKKPFMYLLKFNLDSHPGYIIHKET